MRVLCLSACATAGGPVLLAQYSVSNLPQLGDYQSARSSSFDRTGGNHDYTSVKPRGICFPLSREGLRYGRQPQRMDR
jgi:hypothetical protein